METLVNIEGKNAVVELIGRLDTPSASAVETEMRKVTAPEVKDVLIDCTKLTYISSSGLRILISLHKHFLHVSGQLTIKGLAPQIKEVFDMTCFSNIFTFAE